jgi:L-ribulose-5-phosphate 3-epimerase
MQGRLLPKYKGRYQAHPVGAWQREFGIAAALNLDCIEFILDFEGAEANPLLRPGGIDEIATASEQSGVSVYTVCADYFMQAPLHSADQVVADRSRDVLSRLLSNGKALGISDIVLPCVDESSMKDRAAEDRLVQCLRNVLEQAETAGINLALEADLPPHALADLVHRMDSTSITVNYDIGNSAALGFDPLEEIRCYGARISDVHIKDRARGGGSVPLGSGAANFDAVFDALGALDYAGPFIMQAYRNDEGLAIFGQQLDWLREHYLRPSS